MSEYHKKGAERLHQLGRAHELTSEERSRGGKRGRPPSNPYTMRWDVAPAEQAEKRYHLMRKYDGEISHWYKDGTFEASFANMRKLEQFERDCKREGLSDFIKPIGDYLDDDDESLTTDPDGMFGQYDLDD